jgi:glutathione S-transferase
MAIRVLGGSVSPFVRKTRAFLAEKSLPYEIEQINPASPPDGWRVISPLGKIPALDHDGKIVNDSSVICLYLRRSPSRRSIRRTRTTTRARSGSRSSMDGGVAVRGRAGLPPARASAGVHAEGARRRHDRRGRRS